MKIGKPDIPLTPSAVVPPAASKSGSSAVGSQATKPSGVAVTVSTAARALEQADKDDASVIDMDKVNAIKAAIEQGTYKVNAEAIADKLLANAQEMLSKTRKQ